MVKSMCPEVSIILNLVFLVLVFCGRMVGVQKQVVAAEVIVMPHSFLPCSFKVHDGLLVFDFTDFMERLV